MMIMIMMMTIIMTIRMIFMTIMGAELAIVTYKPNMLGMSGPG